MDAQQQAYEVFRRKQDREIEAIVHEAFFDKTKKGQNCIILCPTEQICRHFFNVITDNYLYTKAYGRLHTVWCGESNIRFYAITRDPNILRGIRDTWIITLPGIYDKILQYELEQWQMYVALINQRMEIHDYRSKERP